MPTVTTQDGIQIFYKDWGPENSQSIVSRHGWPLSADDLDNQMLFFVGQGYRVIAHDRRGHGRSDQTDAIMVCIDDPKAAMQIVELVQHEFPQAQLLVRSRDRGHAVELIRAGVDYQIRETVESAYVMGAEGLRVLGFAEADIAEVAEDIRRRDDERLSKQVQRDAMSGSDRLLLQPVREPLVGRKVTVADR